MNVQHFEIQLEDYSIPEILPFPKKYFGTLSQIGEVMECLAADPVMSVKYATTISAFEDYKNGNLGAVHTICG